MVFLLPGDWKEDRRNWWWTFFWGGEEEKHGKNPFTFTQTALLLGPEAHADDQQREGEHQAEEKGVPGALGSRYDLPPERQREKGGGGGGGRV